MIAHEISQNNLYDKPEAVQTKLKNSLEKNRYGLPCVTLDKLVSTSSTDDVDSIYFSMPNIF